jgi:hypothetical protein
MDGFRRELAEALGDRVPLLAVPEWGDKKDRLHFHCAIGRYVPKALVQRCWQRGFIDIGSRRSPPAEFGERRPNGRRARCRRVASYLGKYLGKDFAAVPVEGEVVGDGPETCRPKGRKRYSTTRGTSVEPARYRFLSLDEALSWTLGHVPGSVDALWSSDEQEGWCGPPVRLLFFADP